MQVSDLLELAEEPGLWIPQDPLSVTVRRDGFCIVTWQRHATVERIRLRDVPAGVAEARALGRALGVDVLTWWVGMLSTPDDLAAQLTALGLVADPDVPVLTELMISARPAGRPSVEVRRVTSLEEYLSAIEVDWEVWNVPADDRAERRANLREHWSAIAADGQSSQYLALIDGAPVGYGRVVFTPLGGLLMGGSVLPAARGRGVYTALVHARWQEAVERGVPQLAVAAGAMSTPILEHLGFARHGAVQLLVDRL